MPSLISEKLSAPGTHVLIIGVSEYLHFEDGREPTANGQLMGMEQLGSAARSGSEFAAWVLNEYTCKRAPLSSLRVLLSPSPGERIDPAAPSLGAILPATRANVEKELKGFKDACDTHTNNVAIVYVAGHGIQLTRPGSIVLLHDIGSTSHLNILDGAIDMETIHDAMDHPNTAQTQFWFVDSCREPPTIARRFSSMAGALSLSVPNGRARASLIFYGAITGKQAYERINGPTLFSEALEWCLEGGGAVGPDDSTNNWHISVASLFKALPKRVKELADDEGAEQLVDPKPGMNDAVLHELAQPPKVNLTLNVVPPAAAANARGTLKRSRTQVVLPNIASWPLQHQVRAGLYILDLQSAPPFKSDEVPLDVRPPSQTDEVELVR